MFYSAPDGNGMYFLYGFQGYQEISRITKSGMNLEKTLLESRQLGQNENYSTFDNEIKLLAPSDIPAGTTLNCSIANEWGSLFGRGVQYDLNGAYTGVFTFFETIT